jgi:shikimate kinase
MKVILVGYRACGKSTVGKLLAAKMTITFLDTDLLVEESQGMPVKDIVASHGWDYFREKEKEAIQHLAQKGACVLSTGGGVVLAQENVDLLKRMGIVVWLDAPLADVIARLQNDAQTNALRPQFTDGNIVQETVDTLKQRIPLYKKAADFTVSTEGKSAEQVAEEILMCLKSRKD